jgi:hypothetical protein
MLADAMDLTQIAVHRPDDVPRELPDRCIIQLHWRYSSELQSWAVDLQLRPLTLTRHPLGVLISILHFCVNEPDTCQWLDGRGGNEIALRGHSPFSREFLEYGKSRRAAELLSVSPDWLNAGVPFARYEQLVSSPETALTTILGDLGLQPLRPVTEVVRRYGIESLRRTSSNQHFWRGDPFLWKRLLTSHIAEEIYGTQESIFAQSGYGIDNVTFPTASEVEQTWYSLEGIREEVVIR